MKVIICAIMTLATLFISSPASADEKKSPGYIAIGDSITAGIGTDDWTWPDTDWHRTQRKYSYPARAGVRDFAIGGSCLGCTKAPYDILRWSKNRLENVNHPVTVVALIGINDLVMDRTSRQVIFGLRELRRVVEKEGHRMVFGTIIPVPKDSSWAHIQSDRVKVNHWIRRHDHVDYAKALTCGRWLCDGLANYNDPHVNNRGANIMAKTLTSWIKEDA
jgi:hypothetical protein